MATVLGHASLAVGAVSCSEELYDFAGLAIHLGILQIGSHLIYLFALFLHFLIIETAVPS